MEQQSSYNLDLDEEVEVDIVEQQSSHNLNFVEEEGIEVLSFDNLSVECQMVLFLPNLVWRS